ncbi:MAG: co-chaperone GroES [bacterium]|nr:co-chaperone GroES [bacterium]
MKLKPLEDRVVVKAVAPMEKTKGGIYLPDTAKEKPQEGEIIAVGPGKYSSTGEIIKPAVKKGDRVIYGKYSGTEISVEGEEYMIMRESDLYAIIGK